MYKTPIFQKIHDERCHEQCDKCKEAGYPVGWFECQSQNPMCVDFVDLEPNWDVSWSPRSDDSPTKSW